MIYQLADLDIQKHKGLNCFLWKLENAVQILKIFNTKISHPDISVVWFQGTYPAFNSRCADPLQFHDK